MICSRWRKLVALSAGGDLGADETQRLGDHLEGCAACRELDEQLRRDLDELRAADVAAVGASDLGSVRGEVMARIDEKKPSSWLPARPGPAATAAAVAVAGTLAVVLRWGGGPGDVQLTRGEPFDLHPTPQIDRPAVEPPLPTAEDVSEIRVVEATVAEPAVEAFPVESPKSADSTELLRTAAAEPMTMKILTDDPDVVIYWIVEAKGEEDV
jgi:hypothetical protein